MASNLGLLAMTAGRDRVWFVQRLNGSIQDPQRCASGAEHGPVARRTNRLPKLSIELYATTGN